MKSRKTFAIYVITKHGINVGHQLKEKLPSADLYISPKFIDQAPEGSFELALPMGPTLRETFESYDCHIFNISVGAVVRMISPLIRDKKTDPAVVCVDDACRFSIALLSGHVGRGNEYANRVAQFLGATPVITTASDVRGTLTVDILGRDLGWKLADPNYNVTAGCAAVVNEKRVLFVQETGEPNWWPIDKPLPKGIDYLRTLDGVNPGNYDFYLIASDREISKLYPKHFEKAVVYRPKSLILGLGCDKNTPFEFIERGVLKILKESDLSLDSVKAIASIDLKIDEPGLTAFSKRYHLPFSVYPAEKLDKADGIENPSETVKKYVGTRTVAEGASLLAAGTNSLLLPKRRYSEKGSDRSMTLAISRIPFESRIGAANG